VDARSRRRWGSVRAADGLVVVPVRRRQMWEWAVLAAPGSGVRESQRRERLQAAGSWRRQGSSRRRCASSGVESRQRHAGRVRGQCRHWIGAQRGQAQTREQAWRRAGTSRRGGPFGWR
jgi:hypothetical protein